MTERRVNPEGVILDYETDVQPATEKTQSDTAAPPYDINLDAQLGRQIREELAHRAAARGANGSDNAERKWQPPPVVTYGASFDPAKIPLREWVINGRYALGEGSAIAGPPGVNKSSLLLIDAVQIVTGRNLIGDRIERTGAVLVQVGEDRRRDFEARLAAVCAHFHIQPADLKNRLHVVYQAEVDPAEYALGSMLREMAVLNTNMFEWLRQYPDLISIFIDPMSSWHYMIENDNGAMNVLCLAVRNLAAQTNRAVCFDHHVTKLAMNDPEGHVHNLAAVRGGSIIVGQMRWAFTMAKLKPETGNQFGIAEQDRWLYRRLDPLKASYGPDGDDPRLLKIEVVPIANGEQVGILTPINADEQRAAGKVRQENAVKAHRDLVADALGRMLRDKAPRSAKEAALWIVQNEPALFLNKKGEPLAADTIRKNLPTVVGKGLDWVRLGCTLRIIVMESGAGNATRYDLDFGSGK